MAQQRYSTDFYNSLLLGVCFQPQQEQDLDLAEKTAFVKNVYPVKRQ
jgi:hypothetical protein